MPLQVTREDYFEAALKILATEGHHALKMTPLCKALGVTSGSFYNYFGSWENFAPELLSYWEHEKTVRNFELSTAQTEPVDRRAVMRELTSELPHEAESAIRAWSNGDPAVADVLRRVDQERFDALRTVIGDTITDPHRADLIASMGMSILIGMQSWRAPVDPDELRQVLEEYDHVIADHPTRPTRPTRARRSRRPSAKRA
jgi:AcrR family transcriptional regulator